MVFCYMHMTSSFVKLKFPCTVHVQSGRCPIMYMYKWPGLHRGKQASNKLTLISYQDWKNPVWSHEVSTLSSSPVLLNMTGCRYCKM